MKIGIRFFDNDFFHCCFKPVLNILLERWRNSLQLPTDKARLAEIINELSFGVYLLHLSEHNYEKDRHYFESKKNYLQIKPEQILIDNELNKYFLCGDNYQLFILDTDLDYDNNTPVYQI